MDIGRDELTVYSMGSIEAMRCGQFEDRIEIKGLEVYYFDSKGDILVPTDLGSPSDYRMIKISERTKYNFSELDKLLYEAYEKECRNRSSIKVD